MLRVDGPASRDDRESAGAGRALDGLDVDAEAGAVVDGAGAVAGIHPGFADVGVGGGDADSRVTPAAVSETLAAVTNTVSSRPRVFAAEVALAPDHSFAGVRALNSEVHVGGGLDGLGVQHAGRRCGVTALGFADQAPQQAGELLEHAVLLPLGEA